MDLFALTVYLHTHYRSYYALMKSLWFLTGETESLLVAARLVAFSRIELSLATYSAFVALSRPLLPYVSLIVS